MDGSYKIRIWILYGNLLGCLAFLGKPPRPVRPHDLSEGLLDAGWELSALQLAKKLKHGDKIHLIDVREPHELAISHIDGAENIPLGMLAAHMDELDSAQEIVLFCKSGTRSARALELLVSAGFRKVKNLRGGINAWAKEVDRSLPLY
jgi:adenylyltransferase/sulfurtransferase